MNKNKRQDFIINLITKNKIKNQKQIVNLLNKNNFKVTQATVSRDIQDIKLIKIMTSSGLIYQERELNEKKYTTDMKFLKFNFKNSVISINGVDSLIIIHTIPGSASTLAFYLDQNTNKEILGTIAGDDTLLIILKNSNLKEKWIEIFKNYL